MHRPLLLLCCGLLLFCSGCSVLGVVGNALPPPTIPAAYKGLAGQSVAVIVFADRALQIDFPSIQLDLATGIQNKLKAAQKDKVDEVLGTTFPDDPRSIAVYQRDHPEIESMPIAQIAPVLNANRVIFVEVEDFQTRSDASIELYRGVASVSVKVLEIKNGVAKVAYEENGIRVATPKKPVEGVPNSSDYKMYLATLQELSTQVANRFLPHPGEDEE